LVQGEWLMISGFHGTLIFMERAVALESHWRWSMVVPVVNALGALLLVVAPASAWPKVIFVLSSAGLVGLFVWMWRLHPAREVAIMGVGAAAWCAGHVLLLAGLPVYAVVHCWTAFLLLTIIGERLELSRVRRLTSRSVQALTLGIVVYGLGVALTPAALDLGTRIMGVGLLGMAAWLLTSDIARRTIRSHGLPRYIAACLLLGYGWMAFGGVVALVHGASVAGAVYATLLHALLLGFVFWMIFGHAPIILPALTGLPLTYHPVFYLSLAMLHLLLAYRTYSAFISDYAAQRIGGLFNATSILVFLVLISLTVSLNLVRIPRKKAA
jgi:hypothetical protein